MSNATTEKSSRTPGASESTSEFVQELSRLSENLRALIKSYWESEERKSIERELTRGLEQFSKSINDTLEQLKQDDNLKKAKASVKNAWETAHGPQLVREMRAGALDTLRAINDQLARAATRRPAEEVKPDTASSDENK
ncbi:MAG: hypothetical protein ACUVR3_04835 [Candidatus Roseilinea sp.]|uniref:hypothetical protein n=1 Tax=Candidatus Roseilinea sp. TaxID=2838777 RepID=UPI004049463F